MSAILFLVIFVIAAYICWNCRISRSMIVLITILGIAIYGLEAFPGREYFAEVAPGPSFSTDDLFKAGVVRSSVFNCASLIGRTPEQNVIYANPQTDM